jgi:hypothetical protein
LPIFSPALALRDCRKAPGNLCKRPSFTRSVSEEVTGIDPDWKKPEAGWVTPRELPLMVE